MYKHTKKNLISDFNSWKKTPSILFKRLQILNQISIQHGLLIARIHFNSYPNPSNADCKTSEINQNLADLCKGPMKPTYFPDLD